MKTSNIILVSLFGTISGLIILVFADLRFNGIRHSENSVISPAEKQFSSVTLAPVKFIVIGETTNLTITSGAETQLSVKIGTEDKDPIVQHHVIGDTLFIDKIAFGQNGVTLLAELKVNSKILKLISANQSSLSISDLNASGLVVDLYDSRLDLRASNNANFGSIKVNANNSSNFSANDIALDTVYLNLNHSSAWMNGVIHHVEAELANQSTLSAPEAENMNSHKDKSSKIN